MEADNYEVSACAPGALGEADIAACIGIIRSGEAVNPESAAGELPLARLTALARKDGQIVGVGAIKRIRRVYASIVAERSGKEFSSQTPELGYVAESVGRVVKHFGSKLPVIGFCGAPFTLASYMIEGGGSRNYIHTKKMMYTESSAWRMLMRKLVDVLAAYAAEQVTAGADALQIFDSWVGCLSVEDYRQYVLPFSTDLVQRLKKTGVPIIYFGTDTATLLPSMKETGADVMGVDWRFPIDQAWSSLNFKGAVQGNLDPVLLFAGQKELRARTDAIMRQAGGRPGHIFNLGHGILPETPVENVRALVDFVRELSAAYSAGAAP